MARREAREEGASAVASQQARKERRGSSLQGEVFPAKRAGRERGRGGAGTAAALALALLALLVLLVPLALLANASASVRARAHAPSRPPKACERARRRAPLGRGENQLPLCLQRGGRRVVRAAERPGLRLPRVSVVVVLVATRFEAEAPSQPPPQRLRRAFSAAARGCGGGARG